MRDQLIFSFCHFQYEFQIIMNKYFLNMTVNHDSLWWDCDWGRRWNEATAITAERWPPANWREKTQTKKFQVFGSTIGQTANLSYHS